MNIEMLKTFAANVKHAVRNHETIKVGGGKFSPVELKAIAAALDSVERMNNALSEISALLKDHPDFARGNSTVHYCAHKAISALGDDLAESGASTTN